MSIDISSDEPGHSICASTTAGPGAIRPWGMYLIVAIGLFLGGCFVYAGIDAMVSGPPSAFQAGAGLAAMSLLFIVPALIEFWSAWMTPAARDISFHTNGVMIERDQQNVFVPYCDVTKMLIDIVDPSNATVAAAVARGTISMLIGHTAGIGRAVANCRSYGLIQVTLPDESKPFIIQFGVRETRAVATAAEPICPQITINVVE